MNWDLVVGIAGGVTGTRLWFWWLKRKEENDYWHCDHCNFKLMSTSSVMFRRIQEAHLGSHAEA